MRARNLSLDGLRTLAIMGMMAAHTSRMMAFDVRPAWSRWVLLLEPVIPSLFLLMVGISLTFSFERTLEKTPGDPAAPRAWYIRQARRAGILWALSMTFYVLELGARFPDFVIASGVLATIAYAILTLGALLVVAGAPRARILVIALALAAGTLYFVRLDLTGRHVFAVNTGNAPFFPLWLFALSGALWNLARKQGPRSVFWAGLAALGFAAWMLHHFGLDALFTKPFGRSDAGRDLAAPWFISGGERHVGYYNLRPSLALLCLGLHLGALSLLGLINQVRAKAALWVSRFFILGRHSLEVYVLHLSLLAMLVLIFGLPPLKNPIQGSFVLLGVVLISWGWCLWRERRQRFS